MQWQEGYSSLLLGRTFQELWSSEREHFWAGVGEEALIESTQELILAAPLGSRLWRRFLVEMAKFMKPPPPPPTGTLGGLWVAVEKMAAEFETATVMAMLRFDLGTTTFC